MLGNTYHLMLRPGAERVARLGGLHRFMNWDRPILTDSGGFQVMSLAGLRKLTEEGVTFASHIDGSRHELTPERSMEIQRFWVGYRDVPSTNARRCPRPRPVARACGCRCGGRSGRARRSATGPATRFSGSAGRADARPARGKRRGAAAIGFDGYAIGGLAVGEGQAAMFGVLDYAPGCCREDKPRYLMGVGKPDDIVGAVKRGVDMMDCVLPTRSGRTGQAWTRRGVVNIKNARHADDPRPLDEELHLPGLPGLFSRAYLHHVYRSGEMIAGMLLSWHNLHYYQELMAGMRAAIIAGRFAHGRRRFTRRAPRATFRRCERLSRDARVVNPR